MTFCVVASWSRDGGQSGARGADCGSGGLGWSGSPVPPSCALRLGEALWWGLAEGAGADGGVPTAQGRQSKPDSPGFPGKSGFFSLSLSRLSGREGAQILLPLLAE